MATERLAMNKVREILRLRWQLKLTVREAARSLGVSSGVVSETTTRATKAGLTWDEVEGLGEQELEKRVYGPVAAVTRGDRPRPDPLHIHAELRRPGVTLELLHHEYLEQYPNGFGYTTFCEAYRSWLATTKVTMRQVHTAGAKCFVDYSGRRPSYVDPHTGERVEIELFVAVLGASNYTYAEATSTQQVRDFVASHVRAFAFFEGVSEMVVPDQLKSAVVRACRYEPGIQRTYAELARHSERRSCRRGRTSGATSPKWKSACRSCSAGFWPVCDVRRSSRSRP
jgi:transposase